MVDGDRRVEMVLAKMNCSFVVSFSVCFTFDIM